VYRYVFSTGEADRPIGSCRYSRLRRDQGGDRGGNGFRLLQADCGCEVAGSAPGAAKALYSETASTIQQLGRADVGPYGTRRWTSAIALILATFDRRSCSVRRGPAGLEAESRTICPAARFHRTTAPRLVNKGQSWPSLVLMLVDLHGSLTTLLLSPDSVTTLQVIASVSRLTPMRRTCRT
jgi:hypothetical protein